MEVLIRVVLDARQLQLESRPIVFVTRRLLCLVAPNVALVWTGLQVGHRLHVGERVCLVLDALLSHVDADLVAHPV